MADTASAPPADNAAGPLGGVIAAHNDLLDYLRQSHGALYDENAAKIEQAGAKREHVAYGVLGVLALYLLCASGAPFLCNFLCVIYPAVCTLKALREGSKDEDIRLLTYWSVFAFVTLFDGAFLNVPGFFLFKALFFAFLYLPQTQGARLLYNVVLTPALNIVEGLLAPKTA